MTTTTLTKTILDILHDAHPEGLTLKALAKAAETTQKDVRAALATFEDADVTSALKGPKGKRTRYYRLGHRQRIKADAALVRLAEKGTEKELNDRTKAALRLAARKVGVTDLKAKATKATIIERILASRSDLYATCAEGCGEPVDAAGETCTVCEEAKKPTPVRSTARKLGRPRKPIIEVDLSDDVATAVSKAVAGETSARGIQRAIATVLGQGGKLIQAEELRSLCAKYDALNRANFTVNMKKDGFRAVREGRTILGWHLPS